jgi:hypothetical protein
MEYISFQVHWTMPIKHLTHNSCITRRIVYIQQLKYNNYRHFTWCCTVYSYSVTATLLKLTVQCSAVQPQATESHKVTKAKLGEEVKR